MNVWFTNIFRVSLAVLLKLVILKCVSSFEPLAGLAPPTWKQPPIIAVALKSLVVQLVLQVAISVPDPVLSESPSLTFGYVLSISCIEVGMGVVTCVKTSPFAGVAEPVRNSILPSDPPKSVVGVPPTDFCA